MPLVILISILSFTTQYVNQLEYRVGKTSWGGEAEYSRTTKHPGAAVGLLEGGIWCESYPRCLSRQVAALRSVAQFEKWFDQLDPLANRPSSTGGSWYAC